MCRVRAKIAHTGYPLEIRNSRICSVNCSVQNLHIAFLRKPSVEAKSKSSQATAFIVDFLSRMIVGQPATRCSALDCEHKLIENNATGTDFLKGKALVHFVENDLDLEFLRYASWGSLVLLPDFFRTLHLNFADCPDEARAWLKCHSDELGVVPETLLLSEAGIRASLDYLWKRLEKIRQAPASPS